MSILKKVKESVLGTDEQRAEKQFEKDRERVKRMRKPTLDDNWYLDYARKIASTPVNEDASVFDLENNKAKAARARGVEMSKGQPEAVRDYEAYKNAGYKKGGMVSSASKRADGCAIKGKTKGRMV
jgi:hypothetical protein